MTLDTKSVVYLRIEFHSGCIGGILNGKTGKTMKRASIGAQMKAILYNFYIVLG